METTWNNPGHDNIPVLKYVSFVLKKLYKNF